MSFLRFVCPHCRTVFQSGVGPAIEEIPCPNCRSNLASEAKAQWYLLRRQSKFGPYSWAEVSLLASKDQFLPTDILSNRDLPLETEDESMPVLVPPYKVETSDFFLEDTAAEGPLSNKGIKVRPTMTLTLGDFQVLRKLGAGGMGAVYLARERSKDRLVALKMLSEHLAKQPSFISRFYREAILLGKLTHPNIVEFHGAGEEKGIPFFAMELIEGFPSSVLVRHFRGKLPLADALHIILKCADALRYAHGQDIVHRDIKPENILITRLGKVKIADLGLAKPMNEDLSVTDSGLTMGTPRYMSPEQSRNAKHADFRSDIYALGGVLYMFLTGVSPFTGSTAMELLLAKEKGYFAPTRRLNPEVSPRLELIIDKMLARNPENRHACCADVIRDLEDLRLAGEYLSFNPLRVAPLEQTQIAPQFELAEILLIHDDMQDITLAQEALAEQNIPSNLNVVQDGPEALAFLRREGKHAQAPMPNLIILGSNLQPAGLVQLLQEIQGNVLLKNVPLVLLAGSPEVIDLLNAQGIPVSLTISKPEDIGQFDALLQSIQGMCLTVLQRPLPATKG